MSGEEIATGVNLLVYVVPVLALIVSIVTFFRASGERHAKSAAEIAQIAAKLDHNTFLLTEVKEQQQRLMTGYLENKADIAEIKGKVEAHETRIETLETEIHDLRS